MKKKGFTLIELLAVIIILSVIALITTPIVLNVVDSSRLEANRDSVYGILDGAKLYYLEGQLDTSRLGIDGETNLIDKISITGKRPSEGNVYIDDTGLIALSVVYDKVCYKKGFKENEITETNELEECETKINDKTAPSITTVVTSKTDRIKVSLTCNDFESGIIKYEYKIDDKEWIESNNEYTFENLEKEREYEIRTRCTNGVNLVSEESKKISTKEIINPIIEQVSQEPSSGTYAVKRIIKITYDNTNIETAKNYYSYGAKTWIEVNDTKIELEFTDNGYLYAKTTDSINTSTYATYTIANIESSNPSIPSITYNGGSNTDSWKNNYNLTLSSNALSGIAYYEIDWDNDGVANMTTPSNFIPNNGFSTCNARFRAVSNVGRKSEWTDAQHIHMDTESPNIVSITASSTDNSINLNATDNVVITEYTYSTTNTIPSTWQSVTASNNVNINISNLNYGTTYYVWVKDLAGNISTSKSVKTVSQYVVDVNPIIDGKTYSSGLSDYTFDVYINDAKAATNVIDYSQKYVNGTKIRVVAHSNNSHYVNFDSTQTMNGSNVYFSPIWISGVCNVDSLVAYSKLQECINSKTSSTVNLLQNVTEKVSISSGKTITLNLNNKTITGQIINNGATFTLSGSGNINFNYSSGTNGAIRLNSGTTYIKGGVITAKGTPAIHVSGGTVNISSVQATSDTQSIRVDSNQYLNVAISGGTFNSTNSAAIHFYPTNSSSKLTITGGTFTGSDEGLYCYNSGIVNISGGKFVGNSQSGIQAGTNSTTSITISGSPSFEGKTWDGITISSGNTVNIKGGTFIGKNFGLYTDSNPNITITSGTFTGQTLDGISSYGSSNITITGGTFTGSNTGAGSHAGGNYTITGGTFIGNTYDGLYMDSTATGKIYIGSLSSSVSSTTPVLQGKNFGIAGGSGTYTINYYNGTLKGTNACYSVSNISNRGTLNDTVTGGYHVCTLR